LTCVIYKLVLAKSTVEIRSKRLNLKPAYDLLRKSTVSIVAPASQGSGFFIDKNTIMTCAHIVKGSAPELVKIDYGGRQYPVVSCTPDPDLDIATIKVGNEDEEVFAAYLDDECEQEDEFYIYSHPLNKSDEPILSVKYQGDSEPGDVVVFSGMGVRTAQGLSGSPVLNKRTGKVCGIVQVQRPRSYQNKSSIDGEAVTVKAIFQKRPELRKLNENFHHPLCNLPVKSHGKFIARKGEKKQLLKELSPAHRQHLIVVGGLSGVGKTALVLEVAYQCWQNKNNPQAQPNAVSFEAIVFTSFENKVRPASSYFTVPKTVAADTRLSLLVGNISDVLGQPKLARDHMNNQSKLKNRFDKIYEALNKRSTLLIVDGLEDITSEDSANILDFLSNLPPSTKAIITTRESVVFYSHVFLKNFSIPERYELIQSQCSLKGIELDFDATDRISQDSQGLPIAIIYAVGQYAAGYGLECSIDPALLEQSGGLGRAYFQNSLNYLKGEMAYDLLLAMVIFRSSPCHEALARVAGFSQEDPAVELALTTLQKMSLISEYQVDEERRYRISLVTREYALIELNDVSARNKHFEQEARNRWVDWYRDFAAKYGCQDSYGNEYSPRKLDLELQNIKEVLLWCSTNENYYLIREIWDEIDPYVEDNQYWMFRFYWWEYLEQESKKHAEIFTYIQALSEKAVTWMKLGAEYCTEAKACLSEANEWLSEDRVANTYVGKTIQNDLKKHLLLLDNVCGDISLPL
jgi:archaellum biogenesis ATPase FlaH